MGGSSLSAIVHPAIFVACVPQASPRYMQPLLSRGARDRRSLSRRMCLCDAKGNQNMATQDTSNETMIKDERGLVITAMMGKYP